MGEHATLPPGLVLIGGTAVALYFNHRPSTDLVWLDTSGMLDETTVNRLKVLDEIAELDEVNGGKGAVDCVL